MSRAANPNEGRAGFTATIWVDVPEEWGAERVREEIDAVFRGDTRYDEDSPITLNTVHTPKPDKGLND